MMIDAGSNATAGEKRDGRRKCVRPCEGELPSPNEPVPTNGRISRYELSIRTRYTSTCKRRIGVFEMPRICATEAKLPTSVAGYTRPNTHTQPATHTNERSLKPPTVPRNMYDAIRPSLSRIGSWLPSPM